MNGSGKKIRRYVLKDGKLEEIRVDRGKVLKVIHGMLKRDKEWPDILAKL